MPTVQNTGAVGFTAEDVPRRKRPKYRLWGAENAQRLPLWKAIVRNNCAPAVLGELTLCGKRASTRVRHFVFNLMLPSIDGDELDALGVKIV